ncbi:PspC domain-containing protein [Sciscionella sediminilitoris]|uniref:PspC domain-containing protein n=1 Tax=Sciscionella sediminilitoris TaxID=1445613 RepID=UPI0004DFAD79|nr:PspC domain-containing protein [Sciscionella sp. SE31]
MTTYPNYPNPTYRTSRLARSRTDRVLGGVCGGLAERYGWKSGTVRLVFLLSCLLPGPQFLLYLGLWLVIPQRR